MQEAQIMPPFALDIAELNIRHYRQKLETETNPQTRRIIEDLLRREEIELANLAQSARGQEAASER
jgi:hypothetical protein